MTNPAESASLHPWERSVRVGALLLGRVQQGWRSVRGRAVFNTALPRGMAFAGTVWTGGATQPFPGVVVLDGRGVVVDIIAGTKPELPQDLLVLGGPQHWVVPGIVDAHVHLGLVGAPRPVDGAARAPGGQLITQEQQPGIAGITAGVTAVRDLGSPLRWASFWQSRQGTPQPGLPLVIASGPVLTAPGGFPADTWGTAFTEFISSQAQARSVVQRLASEGVDLIKLALEPGTGELPVPSPQICRAVVDAAHSVGLPVVAHATSASMVSRALDIGVDELAHTPLERLSDDLIDRLAAASITVTSTLQSAYLSGNGRIAAANAADLVQAGIRLQYGTDLGALGSLPGVDPRELDRLADTGLGRLGALRAATEYSANAAGMRRVTGRLTRGQAADLVLLALSPLAEPGIWRTPSAVFNRGRLSVSPMAGPAGAAARTAGPTGAPGPTGTAGAGRRPADAGAR